MLNAFYLALALLTRIPVPQTLNVDARMTGLSALAYPVVGGLIGVLLLLPLSLILSLVPDANSLLLAALVVVLWAVITGGLHLDGLADSADGWLGGLGSREKTLRIMKDPVVGSAGVIAISSILLLKLTAVSVLLDQSAWLSLLFAPVLGRGLILVVLLTTPYVNAGMANTVAQYLPRRASLIVVLIVTLIALGLCWQATVIVLLVYGQLRRLMLERLGGCTGDTLGATVEIGEACWLLSVAL